MYDGTLWSAIWFFLVGVPLAIVYLIFIVNLTGAYYFIRNRSYYNFVQEAFQDRHGDEEATNNITIGYQYDKALYHVNRIYLFGMFTLLTILLLLFGTWNHVMVFSAAIASIYMVIDTYMEYLFFKETIREYESNKRK